MSRVHMAGTSSVTERLYYADSYLRVFEARVLNVSPHGGGYAVILDRTAFFPTLGGQPHVLDRPPEEAAHLAGTIVALEPSVVVFGAAGGRVIIARSPAVVLDAGAQSLHA